MDDWANYLGGHAEDAALKRFPRKRTALVVQRVKPMLGCSIGALHLKVARCRRRGRVGV